MVLSNPYFPQAGLLAGSSCIDISCSSSSSLSLVMLGGSSGRARRHHSSERFALSKQPPSGWCCSTSCQMAPCCSKTAHDPAKSTAATLTAHLPFQWFMPAVPSGTQNEPRYFEIWQPAMWIRYNAGFNIFLRYLAVFAALSDPARPTSCVTAHNLALKANL